MRVLAIAATAGLILLAGCDDQTEPSAPPTTQDALTTVTATPTPPPDDVDVTTDAEPTTAEPTTDEPTAGDGPPEMPAEAEEQTEAGAEAFVLHYVDLLNYTAQNPEPGLLDIYASADCGTCGQFSTTVDALAAEGERYNSGLAEYIDSTAVHTGETAVVTTEVNQPELVVLNATNDVVRTYPSASSVTMEFHIQWIDEGWLVDRIFLVE